MIKNIKMVKDIYSELLSHILLESETWSDFEGSKNTVLYKDFPYGLKNWLRDLKQEQNVPTPSQMEVIDTEGNAVNYGELVGSLKREFSQYFELTPLGNKVDVKPIGGLVSRKESGYFHSTASGKIVVPPGKVLFVCTWFTAVRTRSSVTLIAYINSTDKVTTLTGKNFSGHLGKGNNKDGGKISVNQNNKLPAKTDKSTDEDTFNKDYKKLVDDKNMTQEQVNNLKDLLLKLKVKDKNLYNEITWGGEGFNLSMFYEVFCGRYNTQFFADRYLSDHQYDDNVANQLIKLAIERNSTGDSVDNPPPKVFIKSRGLFKNRIQN